VISAPGETAKWQLLRTRYQKAIAEGASTSQVTAISVLASIYLQAVIAASMEEVEMFLAPLTARSKVREVLRGLVATRQVHTISMGHAPHFYVAGTLPEFAVAPTAYASSSMPASAYFLHSHEHDEEGHDRFGIHPPAPAAPLVSATPPVAAQAPVPSMAAPLKAPEVHTPRIPAAHKPAVAGKSAAPRPHFSRPASHSRDRKPAQSSSSSRTARRGSTEGRSSSARPAGRTSARPATRPSAARSSNGSRPAAGARWTSNGNGAKNGNGNGHGKHVASSATNGSRSNGNGSARTHSAKVTPGARNGKPASAMGQRNGNGNGAKTAGKAGASPRGGSLIRKGSGPRKDVRGVTRTDSRSSRSNRKPALAAGAKAGNAKRYGFTAPAKPSAGKNAERNTKKRG
jgi:hypothetical protein